jgi:hypothetical protein
MKQVDLFSQWANQKLDPRAASQAINTYKQAANSQLNQALDAMSDNNSKQESRDKAQNKYLLFKYSASSDAAAQAINTGASVSSVNFNTDTMETSLSHVTANGSASGFFGLFSGSRSLDQLNTKASGSGFSITGHINGRSSSGRGPKRERPGRH